jgi:hypothetical protein
MTTVPTEASRCAAPATRPTLGTTSPARGLLNFKETPDALSRTPLRASRDGVRNFAETSDPIQIHARAVNSLAMALHYLRQPESNVPGASRKAVQALAAINALRFAGRGEAANDGRA